MGATCGCTTLNQINSPHPPTPPEKPSSTRRQANKFQDINPQQQLYICLSEHDLNLFKKQISQRLNQYELNNGIISKRLTFEHENFTSRNEFYVELEQKMKSGLPVKSINRPKTTMETQTQPPLNDDNIKCEVGQQLSQSNQESQKDDTSNQSCLLSQQTHILKASLFTQRVKATQMFYSQFRYFGEVESLQWDQKQRKSYCIQEGQLDRLLVQKVDQKYIVLLQAVQKYQNSHGIHLLAFSNQPEGVKLHFNGKKRLLPIDFHQNSPPNLAELYQHIKQFAQTAQFTDLTYFLTGWIPQILNMSEINNFKGIFQRLSSNIEQGNTLISFSKRNLNNQINYVSLIDLNLSSALITFSTGSTHLSIPDFMIYQRHGANQVVMTFENFIEIFDTIHINWNAAIYETMVKRQGIIPDNQQKQNTFLLVIPPSSQDIEVRLFIQQHHNYHPNSLPQPKLIIELFECEQSSHRTSDPIRTIEVERSICSDVFIFESCKEKTKYLLSIKLSEETQLLKDLYFTVTMLSFVEMHFDTLQQAPIIKEITCDAIIDHNKIGFGINSPYFDRNLQFSIETQREKDLRIEILASNNIQYQICLVPDERAAKTLSKINLQAVINNAQISPLKTGVGNYTIKSHHSHYLLILNCYSAVPQAIQIKVQLCSRQISNQKTLLTIQQLQSHHNIIFVQEIKWLPTHTGPRKRLKSNSNSEYQPYHIFSEFFKNPIIDKSLPKGRYQFFVKSHTFKEYFDSVQSYEDRNMCDPPALSIAVLKGNTEKKEYKIIADDAFYIPFGLGLWSQEMELEDGSYRFVCPKLQKSYAVGVFGIIRC